MATAGSRLLDDFLSLIPDGLVKAARAWAEPLHGPAQQVWAQFQPHLQRHAAHLDAVLGAYQPWEVAAVSCVATVLAVLLVALVRSWWGRIQEDGGLMRTTFTALRSLPPVARKIAAEKEKMRRDLLAKRVSGSSEHGGPQEATSGLVPPGALEALPEQGMPHAKLLEELRAVAHADKGSHSRQMSGSVYMGSPSHRALLDTTFALFSTSNPLHADAFPSVRRMEAEVVAMTASLLGGGPHGPCPTVCGSMTSGGTESILMAMKAARDWARTRRGVRKPELVVAKSAHAAYFKAAEYFGMRLVVLPVGADMRLSGAAVRRALTRNTAAVVASAPGFPHGVVDHVADIAKVCAPRGVWVHVDACLGGFVLPFARKLGYDIPPFDFAVKGVCSISVDTHKFAMAHKGSSVVLYAHPDMRQHQYTSITDWSGGLYISPSMAGSRPGALIATAWTAMVAHGEEGYLRTTRKLMEAAHRFADGVNATPELEVVGKPDMCVVAFGARPGSSVNIYKLNDLMSRKGWHLNALQLPPAIHFCFTAAHVTPPEAPAAAAAARAGTPKPTASGLSYASVSTGLPAISHSTGGNGHVVTAAGAGAAHDDGLGGDDVVSRLLADLREGVETLVANPDAVQGGSAPMYGMANVTPDRGLLAEFLTAYQDVMLAP